MYIGMVKSTIFEMAHSTKVLVLLIQVGLIPVRILVQAHRWKNSECQKLNRGW